MLNCFLFSHVQYLQRKVVQWKYPAEINIMCKLICIHYTVQYACKSTDEIFEKRMLNTNLK